MFIKRNPKLWVSGDGAYELHQHRHGGQWWWTVYRVGVKIGTKRHLDKAKKLADEHRAAREQP